eukprot:COSAG02_NODE_4628_length_5155_cov_3.146931_1_plen_57_part_00
MSIPERYVATRTEGFVPQGCLAVVDDSQEENAGPPLLAFRACLKQRHLSGQSHVED